MGRIAVWTITRQGKRREFAVHFHDHSAERGWAVNQLSVLGAHLYSTCPITNEVWSLPDESAKAFLEANPVQETFDGLYIAKRFAGDVKDSVLDLLAPLTELTTLKVSSNLITDFGVAKIEILQRLQVLSVHSPLLTDECLSSCEKLKNLRRFSFQGKCGISAESLDRLIAKLPVIEQAWGPNLYHWPRHPARS